MNQALLDILVILNYGFWKGDTLQIWLRVKQKKLNILPMLTKRNRGKSLIKGVPFVLTYHPKLKSSNKILTKICTSYIWMKQ